MRELKYGDRMEHVVHDATMRKKAQAQVTLHQLQSLRHVSPPRRYARAPFVPGSQHIVL